MTIMKSRNSLSNRRKKFRFFLKVRPLTFSSTYVSGSHLRILRTTSIEMTGCVSWENIECFDFLKDASSMGEIGWNQMQLSISLGYFSPSVTGALSLPNCRKWLTWETRAIDMKQLPDTWKAARPPRGIERMQSMLHTTRIGPLVPNWQTTSSIYVGLKRLPINLLEKRLIATQLPLNFSQFFDRISGWYKDFKRSRSGLSLSLM